MKNYKVALLLLSSMVSTAGLAQAVLSQTCDISSKIKLPANSSGFYMSADCKTAYILPPEIGTVSISGISESSSLQRCDELDAILKNMKALSKRITSANLSISQDTPRPQAPAPQGWGTGIGSSTPTPAPVPNQSTELPKTEAEIVALLEQRQQVAKELMEEFGSTPAAVVQLNYKSGYGELLNQTRKLNSSLGLNISALPLSNTHFSFRSPDFKTSSVSMALSSGFPVLPTDLMNGSTSGSVELSLLGACPLRGYGDRLPRRITASKIAPLMVAAMSYEYELISTSKYKASYHKGGLAKKIKEFSTKGGFFKTSSASKLTTSAKSESWFNYESYCDDSRACEPAHQENIISIKQRLMDEVLSNITLVKIGYELQPTAAATPGRNGSSVAAEEVKKCPHIYCQAAGAVLSIASASLSETSKTDSYINKETHWVEETEVTKKPFKHFGSMGFEVKDDYGF